MIGRFSYLKISYFSIVALNDSAISGNSIEGGVFLPTQPIPVGGYKKQF